MYSFDEINEKTGFANGGTFTTEQEVREYFTVASMKAMFGADFNLDQPELDRLASLVIVNKWHFSPVLSIAERFILRRDEKAAFEQKRKEEEAEKTKQRLTSLLSEYVESNPEVVAMCSVSGVHITSAISKTNQTQIVFTYEGRNATYNYNGGKSIGLTTYWGEHDLNQYAEVLHAALFTNEPF